MSFTTVVTINCDHPTCDQSMTAGTRWDAWVAAGKAGWQRNSATNVLCPTHRPQKAAKVVAPKADKKVTKKSVASTKATKTTKATVAKARANAEAKAAKNVAKAINVGFGQSTGKPARTAKTK